MLFSLPFRGKQYWSRAQRQQAQSYLPDKPLGLYELRHRVDTTKNLRDVVLDKLDEELKVNPKRTEEEVIRKLYSATYDWRKQADRASSRQLQPMNREDKAGAPSKKRKTGASDKENQPPEEEEDKDHPVDEEDEKEQEEEDDEESEDKDEESEDEEEEDDNKENEEEEDDSSSDDISSDEGDEVDWQPEKKRKRLSIIEEEDSTD